VSTIAERVAKGTALLDEKLPGWWRAINLVRLELNDCQDCLLGQLFGDYDDGLPELGLSDRAAAESGFAEPGFLLERTDYPSLGAEWVRVILARREAGAQ
jgi:hypothetical protein